MVDTLALPPGIVMTTKEKTLKATESLIEKARGKLSSKLPTQVVCSTALEACVKNDGSFRKTPPVFRKNPLGSILYRLIYWHRGCNNAYLGTLFTTGLWSEIIADPGDNACETIIEHNKLVGDTTGRELHDQLDTLALVLLGGKSSSVARWQEVLT
jgi:hypothetical protein